MSGHPCPDCGALVAETQPLGGGLVALLVLRHPCPKAGARPEPEPCPSCHKAGRHATRCAVRLQTQGPRRQGPRLQERTS
jgi:hypothetical protein